MEEKSFKVLYAKAGTKKRKAFSDGMLRIKAGPPPTHIITLTGEDGCELGKRTERGQINFKVGTEVPFGSFVLQIDEEVVDYGPALRVMPIPQSVAPNQPAKLSRFTKQQVGAPKIGELRAESIVGKTSEHDSFWNEEETTAVSAVPPELPRPLAPPVSSSSSSFRSFPSHQRTAPPNLSSAIEQDPSLMKLMRPHQVTGADFLISRLLGQALDSSAQALSGSAEITGAILADEMGVGKTLTSIAAVWAFVRRGGRKCLVVCPSSLVDNWLKEIKHWLGTKLKPLALRPGADAAAVINTFAISMATLYPLMVLSYEMFRKHAALLNTVPNLELMVCDEGHRLKNIGGTKTMDALSACKARRRIILSGTPIQNDLDELYAVVAFIAPGLLGTLSGFKSSIAGPISRSNESDAGEADKQAGEVAAAHLRDLLSKVMLRRTQADILTHLLPARHDYVVYCAPTQRQYAEYISVADEILRSLGGGPLTDQHQEGGDWSGSEAEAEEVNAPIGAPAAVLAGLQSLRGLCNSCAKQGHGCGLGLGGKGGGLMSGASGSGLFSSAKSFGQFSDCKENAVPSAAVGASSSSGPSAKIEFLMRFLTVLRKLSPDEKVVIVSNFTTALDAIEAAVGGRWGESLRLDGKVPVDQRQALVNRFNKEDDSSFLFLLSAKAGGVGINLVGGSRLIMLDVDWNPAVDHQAMSRIWREGQRREVHIYRLVTAGTIEEAILQRQRSKTDLADMVEGDEDASAEAALALLTGAAQGSKSSGSGRKACSERRMSLTRSDVLQLVYPGGRAGVGVAQRTVYLDVHTQGGSGSSGSSSSSVGNSSCREGVGEEVIDAVAQELGTKVRTLSSKLPR